jgi:hypothetical protein
MVVPDPADNVIRSCASGCGVATSAYDSDATGCMSNCDGDSEISSLEDRASDSDFNVES